MKLIYFFPLLLLALLGCKKELSPEELQQQELSIMTADTMKWNILASTGNGNPVITQEYTLIPK